MLKYNLLMFYSVSVVKSFLIYQVLFAFKMTTDRKQTTG